MSLKKVTNIYGDVCYFNNKLLHRTDGPAIEGIDGDKEYWLYGKRHRLDGPAIECANGHKEYWVKGKLHREDGPAIERTNNDIECWVNGILEAKKIDSRIIIYQYLGTDSNNNVYYYNSENEVIVNFTKFFTIRQAWEYWENQPEILTLLNKICVYTIPKLFKVIIKFNV